MIWAYLLVAILLVLGILNPVSGNSVDGFISIFLFVFTSIWVFGSLKRFVFFKQFSNFAIFVLIGAFLISSWATSDDLRAMLSRNLPLYTYNSDPGVFLKTYQLMEGKVNYYDAFLTSVEGTFERHVSPADIWAWRLPTIFIIWKLLPGTSAISVYFLYLLLASSALFCAAKIGEKYLGKGLGIISVYLVFPYLHFGARDQMILVTEWWGVLFFVFALYFLVYKKDFWAIIFLTLAVLVRELFLIPAALIFVYCLIWDRKKVMIFLIPILAFLLLFLFHLTMVDYYIDAWSTLFLPRTVRFGSLLIMQTLAFGSWEYLLFKFRPFWILLALAVMGAFYSIKKIDKNMGILLLFSFVAFPISFLKIGGVPFNDYWGIEYMPQVLILAPISLAWFVKSSNGSVGGQKGNRHSKVR